MGLGLGLGLGLVWNTIIHQSRSAPTFIWFVVKGIVIPVQDGFVG